MSRLRTLSTWPPCARPLALKVQAPVLSACTLPSSTPLS